MSPTISRVVTSRSLAVRCAAALLVLSIVVHSTACSFAASSNQRISVASDPDGADVLINGGYIGTTPLSGYMVNRSDEMAITIRKEGYKTTMRNTSRKLSTTGILDIVGGCFLLLPFLGLLADGAWEQEPNNISVILQKDNG